MNQADAHFAGWLICPVCKKETRHYTKDTHQSPVSKMRRIWCEDCRVVQMQFKQDNGKWEQLKQDCLSHNLCFFFDRFANVERIKVGNKQIIDTLICEEALLFAKHLRHERKEQIQRTVNLQLFSSQRFFDTFYS